MSNKLVGIAAVTLVVGAAIGWWAGSERDPDDAVSREIPPVEAPAPRLGGPTPTAESNAEVIAKLQASVVRLEQVIREGGGPAVLDPEKRRVEALRRLKEIENREQQAAIQGAVKDLRRIGDPVVTDLVRLLKTDFDRDWGGYSPMVGNAVKSYGRLRTAWIDALRQIGSRQAKTGLLEAVGASEDLADYRDLLTLYQGTEDLQMREGISALMPGLLRLVSETGLAETEKKALQLLMHIQSWIRRNEMVGLASQLAELVETSPPGSGYVGRLFAVVVELDPARAAAAVKHRYDQDPDMLNWHLYFGPPASGGAPLAQVSRVLESVFTQLELTELQRVVLYNTIQPSLCYRIKDPAEQATDGRVLLGFLERRREAESRDSNARARVEHVIKHLRATIERREPE